MPASNAPFASVSLFPLSDFYHGLALRKSPPDEADPMSIYVSAVVQGARSLKLDFATFDSRSVNQGTGTGTYKSPGLLLHEWNSRLLIHD